MLRDAVSAGTCANIFYLPLVTKVDIFGALQTELWVDPERELAVDLWSQAALNALKTAETRIQAVPDSTGSTAETTTTNGVRNQSGSTRYRGPHPPNPPLPEGRGGNFPTGNVVPSRDRVSGYSRDHLLVPSSPFRERG